MADKCSERRLLVPSGCVNACYMPVLTANQRTQIFFGGAGSGKSVFLATRVALDALCGRSTLVVRQTGRSLRSSCFHEVQKAIGRLGLTAHFDTRLSDLCITCKTSGAQILFHGLDDAEKLKSITPRQGVLSDIWVEEATQCRLADIKQLQKRLRGVCRHDKRLTMSFNPVSRSHWLYREYFEGWQDGQRRMVSDALLILRTTHLDNAWLTDKDREAYEGERDAYYHRVYTQGEWGEQDGQVFTHWRQADLTDLPLQETWLRYGLDFGFAAHPAACVKAMYDAANKRVYVLEAHYYRGLGHEGLAARIKGSLGGHALVCDSAEPKAIAALRALGVRAMPARKGPDSVRHGIRWLAGLEVVVHFGCREMAEELSNYTWRQDAGGMRLPTAQGEDHLLDALRYALEADSRQSMAKALCP